MRFRLRTLFLIVTLICAALVAGKRFVAYGYIDDYSDYWVPQVASRLPILESETSLDGVPCRLCAGELYEMFGYEAPYLGVVQFGCIPKTYEIDPNGDRFEFTNDSTARISVRTIFGWSHFHIRREGDSLTIQN